MPDGGLLNLQYDKVKDNLDVGTVTNAGLSVRHSFQYDHDNSLDMNIQEVYRQLLEMPEYRQKDGEQEEHVAKSAFRSPVPVLRQLLHKENISLAFSLTR